MYEPSSLTSNKKFHPVILNDPLPYLIHSGTDIKAWINFARIFVEKKAFDLEDTSMELSTLLMSVASAAQDGMVEDISDFIATYINIYGDREAWTGCAKQILEKSATDALLATSIFLSVRNRSSFC